MLFKRKMITLECKSCGKVFERKVKHDYKPKNTVYCSVSCKRADKDSYRSEWTDERRKLYSDKVKGEKNPNFGKKWNHEQRHNASITKLKQYEDDPTLAYRCGKANRGKKFSKDRVERMHGNRTSDSYRRTFDDDTKKRIGKKSKEKFTPEFKEKYRKTMEERGYWIPLDQLSEYDIYFKESNWLSKMVEYFSEDELDALNEFGFFSSKKNSKGYVRDHILPRCIGYELNIPSFILRHPANMQFIPHSANVSKGMKDKSLTKEQKCDLMNALYDKILNFNEDWEEQYICVNYIRETRGF